MGTKPGGGQGSGGIFPPFLQTTNFQLQETTSGFVLINRLTQQVLFTFSSVGTLTVLLNLILTGKITTYNNIATTGLGAIIPYAGPTTVAWAANPTTIVSYANPATTGNFFIAGSVSAVTNNDSVTIAVDYTDVTTNSVVTNNILSAAIVAPMTVPFFWFGNVKASTTITCEFDGGSQTTTKATAFIAQAG